MGKLEDEEEKSDYEQIRKARISENQARLASLGLTQKASELKKLTSSLKPEKPRVKKSSQKLDLSSTPLRRSTRLSSNPSQGQVSYVEFDETGNGKRGLRRPKISAEALARRCDSKARGSLYDPTYGLSCHFCRQKKLCGEDDCKRCGDLDMDQPCIGKTECSMCHSGTGVLCRACLKIRYGEEMEDVRANKEWICPHCTEEKGINPYWICNSSICLKKRKMVPTGIAIYRAREMGFESVAHLVMHELKQAQK